MSALSHYTTDSEARSIQRNLHRMGYTPSIEQCSGFVLNILDRFDPLAADPELRAVILDALRQPAWRSADIDAESR